MMLVRRACLVVLAYACAVAGLAGCGSGQGPVMECDCPATPPPAYALDVTTAGLVRWRVPLAPAEPGLQVPPLAVGAVAVFVQDDVLYGLRLADGRRLWSRAVSQDIAGMWRWQDLIVVLTGPGRTGRPLPVLTGLDASTGRPRWTLPLGADEGGLSPTADGGLAITVYRGNGVLEVVDLSSGRVRWALPVASTWAPVAVGGAVLFAGNSQLTSYDDRTGQVRWTEALRPWTELDEGSTQASGLVYLTGEVLQGVQGAGGQWAQVLLGISAAGGRVQWRIVASPPGSLDPYAPGLMSVTVNAYPGGTSQEELDPATGRVRWKVVSLYHAIATPGGIVTAPGPDQVSMRDTLTGQTRWTARLAGGWLPLVTSPWQGSPGPSAFPVGPLLVVPAAGPAVLAAFRMSDGHRAWQVTIPGPLHAPLTAVPGGMLAYAGITW
jgi:outer membrane protein assembly factor BamB